MKMKYKYLYFFGWFSMSVAGAAGQDTCTADVECISGEAPFCVDGMCRECRDDSHCEEDLQLYCRPSDYSCVRCLEDSHCSDQYYPYCVEYTCVNCLEDVDCINAGWPFCVDGHCVTCLEDSDCQTGYRCESPHCVCDFGNAECCTDWDCGGSQCFVGSACTCTDNKCVCFAPSSTVSIATPEGGEDKILMSQLRVNDRVLTGSGDFKKVIAFSTFSPVTESGPQQRSQYLKITLESSTFIQLTPSHMIYVKGKKYPIEASNVRVGDYLIKKSPQTLDVMEKVVSVDSDNLQGGFAPVTEDGTIVVNGLLASCYSNPRYQTSEYVTILGIPVLHRQVFTHMLKSPVRLFCKYISDAPCQVKDPLVPSKMPGHELVDKAHEFVVKWGVEDLGEVAIGTLALAFFLVELMLAHIALLGTVGVLFVLLRQQYSETGRKVGL
jgi:Hint module